MFSHTPVTSSFIESIGYEGDVLEIKFKNGSVGRHTGVSVEDHAKLIGADSIGRHYGAEIRGKFPFTKVEQPEPAESEK